MEIQSFAGYAWAHFGPETDFHLKIDLLSCGSCLTEKEKKDLEPIDSLLTVNLPDEENYFCDRCGGLLKATS
jgi:hypothetical protein